MWILDLVPGTVYVLVLLAGLTITVASMFIATIPFVNRYRMPLQILGTVILAWSIYMIGRTDAEAKWQQRVTELEATVKQAEAAAATASAQVVTKYITRREVVKQTGQEVIKYVDREVVKYDGSCPLPPVVVDAHNAAARNQPVPATTATSIPSTTNTQQQQQQKPSAENVSTHNSAATMRMPRKSP